MTTILDAAIDRSTLRGRGAVSNQSGRYEKTRRVLVDDGATKMARLALMCATRQVLRNGLALIGVSAPSRM